MEQWQKQWILNLMDSFNGNRLLAAKRMAEITKKGIRECWQLLDEAVPMSTVERERYYLLGITDWYNITSFLTFSLCKSCMKLHCQNVKTFVNIEILSSFGIHWILLHNFFGKLWQQVDITYSAGTNAKFEYIWSRMHAGIKYKHSVDLQITVARQISHFEPTNCKQL